VDVLFELTAGCFALVVTEELRAPIVFPIRAVLSERAAGCSALLGTDGLVVLILLPMREVKLELILLLLVLFVERFVITLLELLKFKLLLLDLLRLNLPLLEPLTLDVPLLELFTGRLAVLLFVIALLELLLPDDVLVVIVLPIRDVMLGLILLLVLLDERFVTTFSDLLFVRLFVLLEEIERLLDGVLVVILLPIRDVRLELILPFELLRLVELGTDVREVIDLLDARLVITLLELFLFVMALLEMLLLGVRRVIDLLEMLLLGVRRVIDLLEMLLLGVWRVIDLLEMLLLGARRVIDLLEMLLLEILLLGVLLIDRLELRLDEILLERLEEFTLRAGADRETLRLERFDLLELRLDRLLAANTGSQNNKSANNVQKTRKSEPFRVLYSVF
jgi:hypothetical protein